MTAIIGFNMGSCALLIADTRKSSLEGRPPEDGDLKIHQVVFGMVAGAGTRGMVKAITQEIQDAGLGPNYVPALMRSYVEQAKRDIGDLDPPARYSLENTHLIATTVERAPSGVADARLLVGLPLGNGRFEGEDVGVEKATIIGPSGHPKLDEWILRCNQEIARTRPLKMERASQPDDFIEAIAANITLGATVLSEIAGSCEGVSATFTLGVQFSPTDVRISGPHDHPPGVEWLQ